MKFKNVVWYCYVIISSFFQAFSKKKNVFGGPCIKKKYFFCQNFCQKSAEKLRTILVVLKAFSKKKVFDGPFIMLSKERRGRRIFFSIFRMQAET